MITRYQENGEKIRYWEGIENEKEIELEYPFLADPTKEIPAEKAEEKPTAKPKKGARK